MNDAQLRDAAKSGFATLGELQEHCAQIKRGWFRCQALALGGAKLDAPSCRAACELAEQAAREGDDEFQRTACLASPITTLLHAGFRDEADALCGRALDAAASIVPASSRATALLELMQAAWPLGSSRRVSIAREIFALANTDTHWRVRRACFDAAGFLRFAGEHRVIDELLASCGAQKIRDRVARDAERGHDYGPYRYVR